MKDACFALTGFFIVSGVFCFFAKILPVSRDAWLICVLLAGICLLAGLLSPIPRRGRPTQHIPDVLDHTPEESRSVAVPEHSISPGLNAAVLQCGDVFDESRIHQDLQSLGSRPGLLSQHFALRSKQRNRKKEIELIQQWTGFYDAGKEMLKSKTELLRARNEHWGLQREREEKSAEKEANIAKFQADAAEHRQRGCKASTPQVEAQPVSKDERRRQEKARIEGDIDRLQTELVIAEGRTKSEEDRIRIVNLYQDRMEELRQRLGDYL
jgi:hypothetical protein